ncbi:T9SS type B sorting domain-containing protein [Sediminicola luteus]|uniref:Gliding motility-associated C-terminal domain-containing protein n=1 Tax=Sediminicola luteus TaxID=319238 RepID=A0ABV2TV63_9FLAO
MRSKTNSRPYIILIALLLLGWSHTIAQTLNKPIPADNPNIAGNSPWTAVCASADFNEYFVKFTWNTPLVNSDNSFILELSDANGSFATPTQLASDNTKNTNFNFDFKFALPTTARGEGYKMRVRSTSPAKTSPASDAFSMYYIDFKSSLLISPNGNGNIPPGGRIELCDGNSATLAVHNVANAETYRYNWYRSGTPLAEKSNSITISQAGIYMVEVDYGSICSGSANTLSNDIEISTGASLGIAINDPSKTALCSGEAETLEANIMGQGLTYTWFKNGEAITGPVVDAHTYIVDASVPGFEGDYAVEIDGDGTCLERSAAVTITNAGDFTVTRGNEPNIVLLPSQTKTLSVSTSASSPVYQWYKDGAIVPGETTSTLNIDQPGVYFARVSQSGGACTATAIDSESTTAVVPASFEISVAYATEYEDCSNTSIVLEIDAINALDDQGAKTDVTADLIGNFTYQWKKDGVAVNGATARSISLTDISENGGYELDAVLESYSPTSNSLNVLLLVNEDLNITASSLVSCNDSESITISTTTDLSSATFDWIKDGVDLNIATETLNVSETGKYQLVVYRNGCPLPSNEVSIAPLDDSLITLDSPETVVFPTGGSKTVTASGGTAYQWLDMNNALLSDSPSVTFTEEGSYLLVANIENCEITKQITVALQDTFKVPNVITVNGDGINDQWIIPNTYSRNKDINVLIYNSKGEVILNVVDYQNNWPESTMAFSKQNMVFYYKIKNSKEVLKQGTITIIR